MATLSPEEIKREAERIADYWIQEVGSDVVPISGNLGEEQRRKAARQRLIDFRS